MVSRRCVRCNERRHQGEGRGPQSFALPHPPHPVPTETSTLSATAAERLGIQSKLSCTQRVFPRSLLPPRMRARTLATLVLWALAPQLDAHCSRLTATSLAARALSERPASAWPGLPAPLRLRGGMVSGSSDDLDSSDLGPNFFEEDNNRMQNNGAAGACAEAPHIVPTVRADGLLEDPLEGQEFGECGAYGVRRDGGPLSEAMRRDLRAQVPLLPAFAVAAHSVCACVTDFA